MRLERRKEVAEHAWLVKLFSNKWAPLACAAGFFGSIAAAAELTNGLLARIVLVILAALCVSALIGYRIHRKHSH